MTMKIIYRVDIHHPLLHITNLEVNNLNIMVKLIVLYHQYPEIMFQNLQKIQCKNIILKTDLFLMVIWVAKTGRG